MPTKRLSIYHPLLQRLRQFDRELNRRFRSAMFPGVWAAGLRLDKKLGQTRYTGDTPLNCRSFADTGGDGVHFGFLVDEGKIRESSPVVMTVPCAAANIVVGENLFDFLCLGISRGYSALEQLAYLKMETLEAYTNPKWRPTERWHDSVGLNPGKHEHRVLALLESEFGLKPWRSKHRLATLQKRYAGALEMPGYWRSDK